MSCLKQGVVAGAVAGLLGGMPSALWLSPAELDRSLRSIAYLVPGNRRLKSAGSRRLAGAAIHVAISESFAGIYSCGVRPRLRTPSFTTPALYGVVLWAVNYRLLAPRELKAEDPSLALADHVCWALVVEATLRATDSAGAGLRLG